MKNKIYKLFLWTALIISAQSVWAGGKTCTAAYTYSIDHEISSFTYLFVDMSSAPSQIISWDWSFGDGSISNNQNPEHQYLSEGNHIVSLHVKCSDGSEDIITDTIAVTNVVPPSCVANFTFLADTSLSPYSYQFTDHSISPSDTIISWTWNFGDGSSLVYTKNPSHQYANLGNYTVSLTINTVQGCSSTFSDVVMVSSNLPSCNANFVFSADSVTGNTTLMFFYDKSIADNPIITWHWDFSDGDSSTVQNPVHIFPYEGVYDVVLTITTQSGCSVSTHYPIQVGNPQKYNMWGRVYLGNLTTDKCIALLYKEYNNGYIVPIDTVRLTSVNDTLGVYYFYQILEGKHKIKVILPENSNYDKLFAPTYFGDNLFWNTTAAMNLYQDLALMNINMKPIVQQFGNCMIRGAIMKGNTPVNIPGVQVLLLDASQNVYAYTFSDNQGNYKFEDVPFGSFNVFAEVTGLYSIPAQITLSSVTDTLINVNVHLSKTNTLVSIDPLAQHNTELRVSLYPNPIDNRMNIKLNQNSDELHYQIINNLGQVIREGNIANNQKLSIINTADIEAGFYLLRIFSKNKKLVISKKFIRR